MNEEFFRYARQVQPAPRADVLQTPSLTLSPRRSDLSVFAEDSTPCLLCVTTSHLSSTQHPIDNRILPRARVGTRARDDANASRQPPTASAPAPVRNVHEPNEGDTPPLHAHCLTPVHPSQTPEHSRHPYATGPRACNSRETGKTRVVELAAPYRHL